MPAPTIRRARAVVTALVVALVCLPATAAPAVQTATPTKDLPAYSSQLDRAQPGDAAFVNAAQQDCSDEPRDLPIHEFTNHEEMLVELDRLERVSDGRVEVAQAGRSNRGREIMVARAGTGDRVVLLTSEIHGDEKTGTDAILDLLDFLGTRETRKADRWRDELTIVAIPKMNPDGAELDRRGNDMTWEEVTARFPQLRGAEPAWNYYTEVSGTNDYESTPGFDINRDYNPDLSYVPQPEDFPGSSAEPGWYMTPETQIVRDVWRGLEAEFGEPPVYIDLHHQGACYVMPDDPDEFVTMSLSGKFVADPDSPEGEKYAEYADDYDLDFSKQLNLAAYDALQGAANNRPLFGNITLYPQDIDLPGTGLGSFALNGSGTVLFEVRGQTDTLGQRYRAVLTRAVYIGLDGILSGLSSGNVERLDPDRYDDIPPRGPSIGAAAADAMREDPRKILE